MWSWEGSMFGPFQLYGSRCGIPHFREARVGHGKALVGHGEARVGHGEVRVVVNSKFGDRGCAQFQLW